MALLMMRRLRRRERGKELNPLLRRLRVPALPPLQLQGDLAGPVAAMGPPGGGAILLQVPPEMFLLRKVRRATHLTLPAMWLAVRVLVPLMTLPWVVTLLPAAMWLPVGSRHHRNVRGREEGLSRAPRQVLWASPPAVM